MKTRRDSCEMKTRRVLTHGEAKAFYDHFGARQDWQRFYEDPAIDALLAAGAFGHASSVVELGCGTGRLAERLLRRHLPPTATYLGVDVSSTMVELSRTRLRPFRNRARVVETNGGFPLPAADGSCDRFLSTYVFDLLADEDIRAALADARRLLAPDGRICLASLTYGQTHISRFLCRVWMGLHALRPQWVGGCRPLRLEEHLGNEWRIRDQRFVCALGVCSEVVVASITS
jgi:ubiquinone/menaquinone biosynthesis C-methylase UbiE